MRPAEAPALPASRGGEDPTAASSSGLSTTASVAAPTRLADVVSDLCEGATVRGQGSRGCPEAQPLPSRAVLQTVVEDLRSVLFPGYFGISDIDAENAPFYVGATLDRCRTQLREQLRRGICFACADRPSCPDCGALAVDLTERLVAALPRIQALLRLDLAAALAGDPAATSADEVIFCYPGFLAITNHRLAHELHRGGAPLIPRIINELAHAATGIDIHPGARIGERFFIDHGTGVVIGETARIGDRVRIYQGVTLGAKRIPVDAHGHAVPGVARHPIVEDDVIIYSGATVLGRVVIGRGSVVGGNVWLTRDLAPGARVTQAAASEDLYRDGAGI